MIPLPLLERSARLMADDDAVAEMFNAMLERARNPMLYQNEGLRLDPGVFNAHTFGRVASRAKLTGDGELADFMQNFANERKGFDEEHARVEEAVAAGRVVPWNAATALFRALGLKTDAQVHELRVNGLRFAPTPDHDAFALVKDGPALSVVQGA